MTLTTDLEIEDLLQVEDVHRRVVTPARMQKFEGYMAEIFAAFGMETGTPATEDTPARYIRALFDATSGYEGDPKLLTVFSTECHGDPDCRLSQVVEGPIPFYALCEHHALPFYGQAPDRVIHGRRRRGPAGRGLPCPRRRPLDLRIPGIRRYFPPCPSVRNHEVPCANARLPPGLRPLPEHSPLPAAGERAAAGDARGMGVGPRLPDLCLTH